MSKISLLILAVATVLLVACGSDVAANPTPAPAVEVVSQAELDTLAERITELEEDIRGLRVVIASKVDSFMSYDSGRSIDVGALQRCLESPGSFDCVQAVQ